MNIFDKLKRKFIIINMTLLSITFICISIVIYSLTLVNLNKDINRSLDSIIIDPKVGKPLMKDSILIILNDDNEIIKSVSQLNIENSTLQELVYSALSTGKFSDKIKVDNTSYSFLMQNSYKGIKIAFLDRSHQQDLMAKLLETFFSVAGISLIILLMISIYLTNKTVIPIKEAFEKQKQFIADASHELRTPLTIIKTNTSLILSNPEDTIKKQIKWLNYIGSQTDRMSGLIDEMLSLANLDISENKIDFSHINISKTIESMILTFEAVIYENDISFETNIADNIFINGNDDSIKKLLSIFMDNAIKHTNKNGKISVNLVAYKNKVKLFIKNTGEGIPPEHLEKIFERFYRIDTSRVRETGGYGLGLSIAKSIVNNHKGILYAESTLNKDTTFIVEFNSVDSNINI